MRTSLAILAFAIGCHNKQASTDQTVVVAPAPDPRVREEDWKKPINFTGIVFNEQSNVLSGVQVNFEWTDASLGGRSGQSTVSDSTGRFTLAGKSGRRLFVTLSKPGFHFPKRGNETEFDYSNADMPGFQPYGSDTPVPFYLLRKREGVDLITSRHGVQSGLSVTAPRNGTPVKVDFFTRQVGAVGQLEISQIKPARELSREATEWSFRLAVPEGGLIEHNDEFATEAPKAGYQPVIEFQFKKSETNWTTALSKKFYISFGQPRRYGRIEVQSFMEGGSRLEFAINPDGSRILESKEVPRPSRELLP
jgi:hypothetical protein